MDPSFKAMLARWGFRPIDSNGHPTADEQKPEKQPDGKTRKIVEEINKTPDVNI